MKDIAAQRPRLKRMWIAANRPMLMTDKSGTEPAKYEATIVSRPPDMGTQDLRFLP
jgi:hypothetical protein